MLDILKKLLDNKYRNKSRRRKEQWRNVDMGKRMIKIAPRSPIRIKKIKEKGDKHANGLFCGAML